MNVLKQKTKWGPRVETRLNQSDVIRLDEAAKAAGKNRSEMARQGLLWFLDSQENLKHDERETEVAQAIRYATDQLIKAIRIGVDRICKMLARQSTALGTLYEITWMSMPDEVGRKAFAVAITAAKEKMRRHVEKDEAEIAAAMEKIVSGQ
jgi:hypothetical protein